MTPEQVIADALDEYEGLDISGMAIIVRNDLRAAGLLVGPDKVAVDREALERFRAKLHEMAAQAPADDWGDDMASTMQADWARWALAALSEPQPKPEGTS